VGRDAVCRHTAAGKAVAAWALAVDTGFGDSKQTTWLDCSLWGQRAERLAEHIKKGDRLGVTGEIGTREHEGKTYVTLNVRDVTLLGDGKSGAKPAAPKPANQQQKPADSFEDDDSIPFNNGDA
jgi:single-strand DNA-binding protein